jgi:putative DNA primase/helicase
MIIPFADGDLDISSTPWVFRRGQKTVTPYRFPLSFPRTCSDCPLWKGFLEQLLSPDDILTLQVFLGYAMTPSTDAQSLIVLKGQAGSGKSQIVPLIKAIWGGSYTSVHLHRMLERFGLVSVVNRLILVDDDLSQGWLEDTATLKKLVGTEGELQIERKGADLFSYHSYSKLVTCTNFELQALHDDSEGFARRVLPIDVIGKKHEPGESIGQKIADAETEGVLFWILEGLHRWQQTRTIPISERTRINQRKLITDRDSLHSFCYTCLQPDPNSSLTTEELYAAYLRFCEREELRPIRGVTSKNAFGIELSRILPRMGYEPGRIGTTVRRKGWKAIRLCAEADLDTRSTQKG